MPHSLPPPQKKRKIQRDKGHTDSIKRFEDEISKAVAQNSSLNPLADLLVLLFDLEDPHDASKAIYALYRVFSTIISSGKLTLSGDESAKTVKTWLWEQLSGFVDYLGGLFQDEEKFLRISALHILFSLLKHLSTALTQSLSPPKPQLHVSHFRQIVSALLLCPPSKRKAHSKRVDGGFIDPDVLSLFYETWFSVHDDIRWFFLRESGTLLRNHPASESPNLAINLLAVLELLTTFPTERSELDSWWISEFGAKPPAPKKSAKISGDSDEDAADMTKDAEEEDDWRIFFDEQQQQPESTGKTKQHTAIRLRQMTVHQSLHSLSSHRAVFTRTWLALLPRLSVPGDLEKSKANATRALDVMHGGVMPHLTRPMLVMDWIGACVDLGGSVGLLALNALFILIKDYNLDYPSFFTRLYSFLDHEVLHLKHRARFFRLLDLFLSSTHLPSALLASFIKRLSRLSLSAPPAAIVMVIPFTYNILKRHPALMVMIHRTTLEDDYSDPFISDEKNPMLTQALESSLWELVSHTSHYHGPVSTLCKIFSEAFTKPGYSLEDFLDHTYYTLIETEVSRKIKREPALGIKSTIGIASGDSLDQPGHHKDIVSELWTFG